jgi:hypothetical protein
MSEDQKPAVIEQTPNDFSQQDLEVIKKYQDAGLPNIAAVDDKKMSSIMNMYLSGRTYRQISTTMAMKKEIILYLSYKFNWFELRRDYLADMETLQRSRVVEAKIISKDFLLELQAMLQKKIGNNMRKYMATDNEEYAKQIDLKEVDKLLKIAEILHKPDAVKKIGGENSPAVGINVGEGMTVTKTGENSVEITPKSTIINNALKQLADFRRETEDKK